MSNPNLKRKIDQSSFAETKEVQSSRKTRMVVQYRNNVTHSGHKQKIVVSALQKFIRRGMEKEAFYAAAQLEEFSILENDEEKGSQASSVVTNLINRLRIILPEDASVLTNPHIVSQFDEHYSNYISARKEKNVEKRRKSLISMVSLLVSAKKCRIISDIKKVYFTEGVREFASDKPYGEALFGQPFDEIENSAKEKNILTTVLGIRPYVSEKEDVIPFAELRSIFDGILTNMEKNCDFGFYWADKLLKLVYSKKRLHEKRKLPFLKQKTDNPLQLLYSLALYYSRFGEKIWGGEPSSSLDLENTIRICFSYFKYFGAKPGKAKPHRDNIIFCIWPCLYLFRRTDWSMPKIEEKEFSQKSIDKIFEESLGIRMEIEELFGEFILDIHTGQKGKTVKHFHEIGAIVENEDKSLVNPNYRALYNEFE